MCNGMVFYAEGKGPNATSEIGFYDAMNNFYTVNSANNTGNVTCAPNTFEGVNPLPGEQKQCFCDDRNNEIDIGTEQSIKEYWRGVMAEKHAEEQRIAAAAEAAAAEAKAAEEAALA